MAQTGLHGLIALQSNRLIPYEKGLYPSIIIGSFIPDLDVILVAIFSFFFTIEESTAIFYRTFSHSFFSLIIVYLFFMIMSELKKDIRLKIIGKGIAIGILLHIILDTFLCFYGIHFLWPLPFDKFNLWESIQIPITLKNLTLSLEFLFFRIYAWFLVKQYLSNPKDNGWFVSFLTKWMKIEFILFILFLVFLYFRIPSFTFIFRLAYIPSLIMAIISTLLMWQSIEPNQEEQI